MTTEPRSGSDATGAPRAGRLSADTTMREALERDPSLPVVLMRFHIGGCSLCGFEPDDTIAKVAEDNGVPLDRLLEALNGAAAGPSGPGTRAP